jgi:hypothetical protein
MGQKVNPIIFRLGKITNFKNQYFEKKSNEAATYSFKSLEIEKLIYKFFKDNGLIVQNCELQYIDENSLNINIQYYLSQKTLFYITPKFKRQNNNLKLKNTYIKKYSNYKLLNYQVDLNNILQKKKLESVKSLLKPKNKISKVKRINSSKFLYQKSKIKIIKLNSFLEKFFKSLQFFLKKNYNIFLTLKQLNKNIKNNFNLEQSRLIKKKLINLKKYEKNEFFKEGVNILYNCVKKQNSASLLAEFIATEMQKLKKHNFFLRFVKSTLAIFRSKNIKIKIKGRFNGAPRAKHKIIKIKNGVPALTLNSNIDYAEKTSYTQNGTFGVKVWIHD